MLLLDKIKSRNRELRGVWREVWKPVGLVLSVLSAVKSVKEFHHRSGPYFFGAVAMSALAITILFTVPIKSVRLFARRLVAFLLDLLLFGLVTIGATLPSFDTGALKPSAITSMIIVWAWIGAFALLEWGFAGTPGQKMMGLRIKGKDNQNPSFLGCLARNLLILVVPLTVSGQTLSIAARSKLVASVEWSIAVALLSFFPLSIIFSGGQSLPDILLRIAVVSKRSPEGHPSTMGVRNWLFLFLTTLLTGVIYGFTPPMADSRPVLEGKEPQFPVSLVGMTTETDNLMAAGLRPYLQANVQNAEDYLLDVRVRSMAGNLPLSTDQQLDPQAAAACQQSFKQMRSYKTVRMQLAPGTPVVFTTFIFANMMRTADRFVGRPAFMVVEVSTRMSFGVFDIEAPEEYVLCLAGSDHAPQTNFESVGRAISVQGSFNGLAWLFLGELGPYSYVEKVPVYPW